MAIPVLIIGKRVVVVSPHHLETVLTMRSGT